MGATKHEVPDVHFNADAMLDQVRARMAQVASAAPSVEEQALITPVAEEFKEPKAPATPITAGMEVAIANRSAAQAKPQPAGRHFKRRTFWQRLLNW